MHAHDSIEPNYIRIQIAMQLLGYETMKGERLIKSIDWIDMSPYN